MAKPEDKPGPETRAERIVETLRAYLVAEWEAAKAAGQTESALCDRCGFASPGQIKKMAGKGEWPRPNLKSILQLVIGLDLPREKIAAILFERKQDNDGAGYRKLAEKFEKLADRLEAENERLRKRIQRLKAAISSRNKGHATQKTRKTA